jgi:hypothetical protein
MSLSISISGLRPLIWKLYANGNIMLTIKAEYWLFGHRKIERAASRASAPDNR